MQQLFFKLSKDFKKLKFMIAKIIGITIELLTVKVNDFFQIYTDNQCFEKIIMIAKRNSQ